MAGVTNLNLNCDVINTVAICVENLKLVNNLVDMKYSDLNELSCVTSFVLRFVFSLRCLITEHQLVLCNHVTSDEINHAKFIWLKAWRSPWLKANQAVLKRTTNFMN